jgi:hypothetical protein
MKRNLVVLAAAAWLAGMVATDAVAAGPGGFGGGTAVAAHAGPCTTQIAEVERYIGRLALGQASGLTAPQSIGAQLHHQPTPQSVERAESMARADAQAALDRARKADVEDNIAACTKPLDEAKLIYGLE